MDTDRRTLLRTRFEQATEVPMLVLSLLMVPLLLIPSVATLAPGVEQALITADWIIWGVFAAEFLIRFAIAPAHLRFLRSEWPDLLIVVLPVLRPLRIVRSARALRLLRLGRLAGFLAAITVNARRLVARHHLDLALVAAGAIVLGAAGLTVAFEEGSGGSIRSFGDAIWWAMATITTVGYGDVAPVTPAGRGIGIALMLSGITLFGVITANLAAYLVEADATLGRRRSPTPTESEVVRQLAMLRAQVELLTAQLEATGTGAPDPASVGEDG